MADLVRATVNLSARSQDALERIMVRTGDGKTDVINRALTVYDWATGRQADNATIVARSEDGTEERVVFL